MTLQNRRDVFDQYILTRAEDDISVCVTMEKLNVLLRKTLATATADEICFMYVPKERINPEIFSARFGNSEVEDDGVTYSLNKRKLHLCFKNPTIVANFSWTLSIPPCAERAITSVAVGAAAHSTQDHVTATYAPTHTASTVGTTVLHFYRQQEADAFMRRADYAVIHCEY